GGTRAPSGGGPARTIVSRGLEIALSAPTPAGGGADRAGLERQAAKARDEIAGLSGRLDGEFGAKAPEAVVARERDRLAAARERLAAVEEALRRLAV
ncbi:MAG TPA: hypothetical protein VG245_06480, partial [Candidatus Dormibacteraeota bacterium]|nr:hypothetical protein [Candidatus Dormibacteraeota bacterium]